MAGQLAIAVASGKGGVGKSTVSLNLALALRAGGRRVGLLDADLYGPDIPLMVAVSRTEQLRQWPLWRRNGVSLEPLERFGIPILSAGLLLAEAQDFGMPAPMLSAVLTQLARDATWGPLDYLIVDLPPGTADLQQQLLNVLPLAGALVVVGPQDVAHLDARRMIKFLRDAGVRILGAVENMSGLECPHCGGHVDVFPPVPPSRSVTTDGVPILVTIPLDPAVAAGGDAGEPVVVHEPDRAATAAFHLLAACVVEATAP